MTAQTRWIDDGPYSFAFNGLGGVMCRDNKTEQLFTDIPEDARGLPVYRSMVKAAAAVNEIQNPDAALSTLPPEVNRTIRVWMTGDAPQTAGWLRSRWQDPLWREALENLVVQAGGKKGFLTGFEGEKILLTRRKGRVRSIRVADGDPVVLFHPLQLKKCRTWADARDKLGLVQRFRQLDRPVFHQPESIAAMERKLAAHAGGRWYRHGPDSRLDALCAAEGMTIDGTSITAAYPTENGEVVYHIDCAEQSRGEMTTMWFYFTDGDGQAVGEIPHPVYSESLRTAMILKEKADEKVQAVRF
ncbi:DUF4132 domain-containing protein [Corynebacterium mendelii]|uniref:DUF4132 domain-containing protein n=1 Tax=Corynebacterium mendelii TaxID=2765362 RepID=A0A939E0N1_9CORY|nr:DUF4132 domain-containing protein [Corynebacterium mendelii]MBN9643561.1 DUF4132 domain-containing protein [Corynebacterium mendelii]